MMRIKIRIVFTIGTGFQSHSKHRARLQSTRRWSSRRIVQGNVNLHRIIGWHLKDLIVSPNANHLIGSRIHHIQVNPGIHLAQEEKVGMSLEPGYIKELGRRTPVRQILRHHQFVFTHRCCLPVGIGNGINDQWYAGRLQRRSCFRSLKLQIDSHGLHGYGGHFRGNVHIYMDGVPG